jgi:hypothetical protein
MFMSNFIVLANAAWEMKDLACYFYTTDSSITVVWNPDSNSDSYELRLKHYERDIYVDAGSTVNTEHTFYLPRSGHWTLEIRGINPYNEGPWSLSTDPLYGMVGDQARGWWLYGYLSPVGPIIIGRIENNIKGEIEYGS